MMKDSLPPQVVHGCPFYGVLEAMNVTMDQTKLVSAFSRGRYRAVTRMFDGQDDNVVTTHVELEKIYQTSKHAQVDD